MSALALPPFIAPAKASAPQGSTGAADATGFKSLLTTSLEKGTTPTEAEKPEPAPANDDAEIAAATGLLIAPAPIPVPTPAVPRPATPEADMAAPTAAPTGDILPEIDPSLLRPDAAEKIVKPDGEFLKEAVGRGLRASLKIGSLLTGSLFVDLDYYEEADFAEMGKVGDLPSLPTISEVRGRGSLMSTMRLVFPGR